MSYKPWHKETQIKDRKFLESVKDGTYSERSSLVVFSW
jgi:hypothetical protein